MTKKATIAVFAFCIVLLSYYLFFSQYLSFEMLKASSDRLQAFVTAHYSLSVAIFILGYILGTALSLPVAATFTLAGGFLFGVIQGSLFSVIGATTGATLAFLAVRYLVAKSFQKRFAKELVVLNKELENRGAYYLVSLRFFAVIPFFLLNILAGLSTVSLKTFIVTTLLGILPGSLVFAYAGQSLGTLESPGDILSPKILLAFGLLGLLALLPLLFQRIQKSKEGSS